MAGLMWQFKLSQLLQDNSYKCSAAAETGDRLATIGMGRKVAAAFPPFWRELRPHLTFK